MPNYILIIFICLPSFVFTQVYQNTSNNLPDNGAKGASMDVRAADIDADGDLDIILANEFQPNTILINDGQGVFLNGTAGNLPQKNSDSEDVSIQDFNADGYLDLVFCSEDDVLIGATNVHEFYLGDGKGSFENSPFKLPDSEANAVIAVDLNEDGYKDLLFGNNGVNYLLINNGKGEFVLEADRLPAINRTTQDIALGDVDGDGDVDIMEGNENGNVLLINDGKGYFSDETINRLPQGLNIETRKVSFADVDGDDDLDMFLSNVEFIPGKDRQNRLFVNDGNGFFSDKTSPNLPPDNDYTLDAIFEDVDNDQDLDLILCNFAGGMIKVYTNNGLGSFTDQTLAILGQIYIIDALGIIAKDFNGDGLNDLYICDRKSQNTNNKDLLLIKSPAPNSSEDIKSVDVDFLIIPNPGKDVYTFKMKNKIPKSILLSNANGQLIRTIKPTTSDTLLIDLSGEAKGTYMLIAQFGNDKQIVKKLIKN